MRKKKKSTGAGIISVIVLCICGVVLFKKIDLDSKCRKAENKIQVLESKIADQEEQAREIDHLEAYTQTQRYIEEVARKKLGLVYEDEIIIKPME